MSDPVDSSILVEQDRQLRAWQRAHACMDFCGDLNVEGRSLQMLIDLARDVALNGKGAAELVEFLEKLETKSDG